MTTPLTRAEAQAALKRAAEGLTVNEADVCAYVDSLRADTPALVATLDKAMELLGKAHEMLEDEGLIGDDYDPFKTTLSHWRLT